MDWGMPDSEDDLLGTGSVISDEGGAAALGLDPQAPQFYDAEADDKDEAWMQKMRGASKSDALLSCPLCFTTLCIDCQQHAKFDNQFRAMFVMNCKVKTGELVTMPDQPAKRSKQQKQRRGAGQQGQQQQPHEQQQQQQLDEQQGAFPAATAANQPQTSSQAQQQHQQQAGDVQQQQQAGQASLEKPLGSRLNPVCCAVCETEVGLRDAADGLYIFIDVFASNA